MMKIFVVAALMTSFCCVAQAQKTNPKKDDLLKELAENACKCIDSVRVSNKAKEEISKDVARCIDNQTTAYQLGTKLFGALSDDIKNAKTDDDGNKKIDINVVLDKSSAEYKEYYYEMERYLMANCKPLKQKIASSDKQNINSFSDNSKAIAEYESGVEELKKENFKKAISQFEKALKIDPKFAFAWDNLGLCHRKLGNYDEALNAYSKSLEIDPKGLMPLQNIAIVYQYKKDYTQAIKAYEKLAEIDSNNPEVYYGIGRIYANNLSDYEAGLNNMCKAYILYIAQKSPYRSDAEKVIQQIYDEMKKQGKLDKFNEILKANNISPN